MTQVLIYTDFDGTITNRAGGQCVFTPFYQSLLEGYQQGKINQDYKNTPMLAPEEIQALFEKKFGSFNKDFNYQQPDADMLMSLDAVAFFHEALNNEEVSITIVTRNRQDYIKALLQYQGFSDEEINKITILDSGAKYQSVYTNLTLQQFYPDAHIYILDDSREDFNAMSNAVNTITTLVKPLSPENIHQESKKPGLFEWRRYQQEIRALTIPQSSIAETFTDLVAQTTTTTASEEPDDNRSKKFNQFARQFDWTGLQQGMTNLNSELGRHPLATENQHPLHERNNAQSSILRVLSGGTLGLLSGVLLAVLLIASGVFSSAGFAVLICVSSMIVGGAIGYEVTQYSEAPTEEEPTTIRTTEPNNALALLGSPNERPNSNAVAPEHFPELFSASPQNATTVQTPKASLAPNFS